MTKTIQVRYTLTVDRTVTLSETQSPPAPYTPEEWAKQEILNEGDEMADEVRATDWRYEIL